MAEAFQPDALVKQLLNDPALLKNAMQMANVLAQSGVLDSLAADVASDKTEPTAPAGGFATPTAGSAFATPDAPASGGQAPAQAPVLLPAGVVGGSFGRDIRRHKKLLEALCLHMEGERKEKLEFVIRLLEILELAGGLKR